MYHMFDNMYDYKEAALKYLALLIVVFSISGVTHYLLGCHNKYTDEIVGAENRIKPRFVVLAYSPKGKITHDLLCDEVREDKEHGQVVCRCANSGDLYIFQYPVMIKDVTYTADFIEYNKNLR